MLTTDLAAVPALVCDLHRLQHQPPLVRVRRILDLGDSLVYHVMTQLIMVITLTRWLVV